MPSLRGNATVAATRAFAERAGSRGIVAAGHFRTTAARLSLSSVGLGTYIGRPDAATDREVEHATEAALRSGRVNTLDTALNYRYQRAERSVGRALARLTAEGVVRREEVFVSTKNGYLAPDAESGLDPKEWVERELIRGRILDPGDIVDGSHAMSPSYLEDQLTRSHANLGLERIDLLYLHNAPDAQLPAVSRSEFRRRLLDAFALFERHRRDGDIGAYGLATWNALRAARSDPSYWSLEDAVAVATEAGGEDHGFRFVQFPFNLAMPEAAAVRNQVVRGERLTLFEAAGRLGIGCFTSVPLLQGQLARTGPREAGLSPAQTALQFARSAPGTLGALVGLKRPEHVEEDLAIAELAPWSPEEFARLLP